LLALLGVAEIIQSVMLAVQAEMNRPYDIRDALAVIYGFRGVLAVLVVWWGVRWIRANRTPSS
jgi:hypothetical protein